MSQQDIIDFINENKLAIISDIAERFGVHRDSVTITVRKLIRIGEIKTINDGPYTRNNPMLLKLYQ